MKWKCSFQFKTDGIVNKKSYRESQSHSSLYKVQKGRVSMYLSIFTFLRGSWKIFIYVYRRFPVVLRRSKLYSNRTWAFAFFKVVAFAWVRYGLFTEYKWRALIFLIVNGISIQQKLFLQHQKWSVIKSLNISYYRYWLTLIFNYNKIDYFL